MKDKTQWNLTDIYKNEEEFNKDVTELYNTIEKIKNFQGTLSKGAEQIYNCYKTYEYAIKIDEKLYSYAMLQYHKDMSKNESIKMYKKMYIKYCIIINK